MNMTLAITLFLAVDAIVFFFVLRRVVKVHWQLERQGRRRGPRRAGGLLEEVRRGGR